LASPIAAPGAMPQASAIAKHAAGRKSWMLPEAQNEDLLYIADPGTGGVIVYTYEPPRYKFVGFLADATDFRDELGGIQWRRGDLRVRTRRRQSDQNSR
jgi:hypothetical protein